MSTPQVGQGAVAIFPTFKGFRRGVVGEVDGATRESASRFTKGFSAAGTTAGRGFSDGFKKQTANVSADALKKATDEVAKATRELSAVRLKELDATGKVRVAEAQLADVRKRYADDSAQVVRAQERLAAAQRGVLNIQESVENSTERLARAQRSLADASTLAAGGGSGWGRVFSGFGGQAADGFGGRFRSRVGEIFTGNFLADVAFSIGQSAFRGVAAGIQTGVQFSFDGIQLASDLAEASNAVRVTFGDDIGAQLEQLAQNAPADLALTRRSFLQFATQFSSFAKTIRRDNPAGFIDDLTERGADFASVYNLEVADALTLFQSGLAGETEPLRRYGLDLSAASVQAFAYASGIATAGRELTEAEKVQARWGLLLEQTSAVQGDAGNTSGELARQQRDLAVAFEESQTRLGEYLLPGFLELVTIGNDKILPAFGSIVDRVGPKLSDALGAVDWEELALAVAPVVEDMAILAAEEGIPAVTDAIRDLAAAAPEWIDAWQFLNDPNAQPAKFFNDFINSGETVRQWLADMGIDVNLGRAIWGEAGSTYGDTFGDTLVSGLDEGYRAGLRSTQSGLSTIRSELEDEAGITLRRGGGAYQLGANVGLGIESGLTDAKAGVSRAASDLANTIYKSSRFTLQINSPSRVMQEVGRFAGDGLVKGLSDRERDVVATARSLASSVVPSPSVAAVGGSPAASGALAGRGGDIILQNPDPAVLLQMLLQELNAELAVR